MQALDLVLWPICQDAHWILLAVDTKDKVVHLLDSLPMTGRQQKSFRLWM